MNRDQQSHTNHGDRKAKVRNDARGALSARRGRIQHRASLYFNRISTKQHTGPYQLPEQQKAAGPSESVRSALQYGIGERKRDVDRVTEDRKGNKKSKAGQQGSVHQQNVSPWRLCHFSAQKSFGNSS